MKINQSLSLKAWCRLHEPKVIILCDHPHRFSSSTPTIYEMKNKKQKKAPGNCKIHSK